MLVWKHQRLPCCVRGDSDWMTQQFHCLRHVNIAALACGDSADVDGDVPHRMHEIYYSQRASAGLIITEGVQISPEGKGYYRTPGIYSDAQVKAWKRITDSVHEKGGKIFAQLWHVGRVSHTSLQIDGLAPVAPSAIRHAHIG